VPAAPAEQQRRRAVIAACVDKPALAHTGSGCCTPAGTCNDSRGAVLPMRPALTDGQHWCRQQLGRSSGDLKIIAEVRLCACAQDLCRQHSCRPQLGRSSEDLAIMAVCMRAALGGGSSHPLAAESCRGFNNQLLLLASTWPAVGVGVGT
jgi:hypothetical protein